MAQHAAPGDNCSFAAFDDGICRFSDEVALNDLEVWLVIEIVRRELCSPVILPR